MPRCLFLIPLISLVACCLEAKCGNSMIVVEGIVAGSASDVTASLQVNPDPNWSPQPAVLIDADGKFRATVYFDRTKAEGHSRDNCSRKPDSVMIQLRKDNRVVDQVNLKVDRDFVRKSRLDYKTRSPITLHSD